MAAYFSAIFGVSPDDVEAYGAIDVICGIDLPLFIDPFLLFNSTKPEYRALHDEIIQYLAFLREKSANPDLNRSLLDAWYRFPEVRQNCLGFCFDGNSGSGLGPAFRDALHTSLNSLFRDFGNEKITKGSHLEKLCLIKDRVGKDNISDFTTNLIKGYLAEYTQAFSQKFIKPQFRKKIAVRKAKFNYRTETWEHATFDLPFFDGDFVILTPKDILTKDEMWISKQGLIDNFHDIPNAIPNPELRAQIDNYFRFALPSSPDEKDVKHAISATYKRFPELIDYYIKFKEEHGDEAVASSLEKVNQSRVLYVEHFRKLIEQLRAETDFYNVSGTTADEAKARILFLKDVIENKDGYRLFYVQGKPIRSEKDLHICYRLTWFDSASDVNREVNNGRGPVDYKVSRGAKDSTLVEFKLASNSSLKRNLENQVEIYKKASDAKQAFKVILFFSDAELEKVRKVLEELEMKNDPNIFLIDARDNKASASKADSQGELF